MLALGMTGWVDCEFVHDLKIHLDFISECGGLFDFFFFLVK